MNISVGDIEVGTIAPGNSNAPTILRAAGLTAGGSGSQSFATANTKNVVVNSTTSSTSHHHE